MQCNPDVPTAKEGPVLQRRSVVAAPAQLEENCVRPVPVGHLAHGRQINTVTIQHPEERRVAYSSTQCQQGYGLSLQNVQGCRHHQESKTSRARAEFQHLNPGDHPFTLEHNWHQVSRKANAIPSAWTISSQSRGSSLSENKMSISHPLLYGLLKGISSESSYFTSTSSSLSQKPGPRPELRTSTCVSDGHLRSREVKSSLASPKCGQTGALIQDCQTGTHSAPSEPKFSNSSLNNQPPTDQSSVAGEVAVLPTEPMSHVDAHILQLINKKITSLKANRHQSDCDLSNSTSVACCPAISASDNEVGSKQNTSCAKTDQSTSAAKQGFEENGGKGSKAKTLNTEKRDHTSASKKRSTGTPTSAAEHTNHASNVSVDKCACVDFDLPLQKYCSAFDYGKFVSSGGCEDKAFNGDENFQCKVCGRYLMKREITLHYSLTALKELIASLDIVETNAEMDNFSEVIVQQYWNGDRGNIHLFTSTEYPQIMLEVAATCTKSEEESPVVLTEVLPCLTMCGSPSQEDNSFLVNAKKNLDGKDQVPGAYLPANQLTEKEKGGTGLKPAEVDSVQGVVNFPEVIGNQDANTNKVKCCRAASGETAAHSKRKSSTDEMNLQKSEWVTTNQVEQPVCHNTRHQSFGVMGIGNIQERAPTCKGKFCVTVLRDPQYDNVSDDEDTLLPDTELQSNKQHGHVQDEPVIEIISDEELIAVTEPLIAAQRCCCPYFVETCTGFECVPCPKCDSERHLGGQTKGSCSPSSVMENEDETNDQMDDSWFVIPLIISDITLDKVNEDQADPEEAVPDDGEHGKKERQGATSDLHRPPSNPVPASASPKLEVFVIAESCTQAQGVQLGNCFEIVPEGTMPEVKADTPQKIEHFNYESDDSCETDDSCNYSPGLERNYLTMSALAWRNLSANAPSEAVEAESEKENEDQRKNLQKGQSRSEQNTSITINLSSDTEDENNKSCANTAKKRKRSFYSGSEVSGGALPGHQKRQSPKTVDRHRGIVQKIALAIEYLSNCSQELPKQKISNDMSERVNTETENASSKDGDYKNAKRTSMLSSESVGVCSVQQKTKPGVNPPEPNPQHQSKLQHARSKEETQAVSSELPHSEKSKALTEAKAGSEHIQQKINRHVTSRKKHKADKAPQNDHLKKQVKTVRRNYSSDSSNTVDSEDAFSDESNSLSANKSKKREDPIQTGAKTTGGGLSSDSSETEDSEDVFSDSSDTLCTNKKPEKMPVLSKVTPEKQSADSRTPPLVSSFAVPRLYVQEPPQSSERLKLSKQPQVNKQGNSETRAAPKTPTAIGKKADPCKERSLHSLRDETGRVVHKPKPSNDTRNTTQMHKSKLSSSGPIKPSPLKRQPCSRSYSHPSTSDLASTSTKEPSFSTAMHTSAMTKVTDGWKNVYFPITRRRKASLGTEDMSINRKSSNREAIPGPRNAARLHRRRHSFQKSETTLMKRTKFEAKERTRDINLNPRREKSYPVADHYKWKSCTERWQTKGSFRQRRYSSPPRLEDWD